MPSATYPDSEAQDAGSARTGQPGTGRSQGARGGQGRRDRGAVGDTGGAQNPGRAHDPGGAQDPGGAHDPGGDDPVLAAERAHLRSSRDFLRVMRENVLSLRALGGDPVSEEYLKADL